MFKRITLDNGMRVIFDSIPQVRSVSISLFIGAGSRYETKENNGISHFLEHMAFKGTKKYPTSTELRKAINKVGGYQNGHTSMEKTEYTIKAPKKYLSLALDILSEQVFNSLVKEEEVEKEKGVIFEEINMYFDSPSDFIYELVASALWPDQPLGRNILGAKESIKNINRNKFLKYIESFYVPNNMVLSIAGDLDYKEVLEESSNYFKKFSKQSFKKKFKAAKEKQEKPEIKLFYKKTDQAHIGLGIRSYSRSHKDQFTLMVLNPILASSPFSRLWVEIRENRGWAYYLYSFRHKFLDAGFLGIYSGLNNKEIFNALNIIFYELEKLKRKKISEDELEISKEYLKGWFSLKLENTDELCSWLGEQELLDPKTLTLKELYKKIDAVTTDDIQRVAKELFIDNRLSLALIGPFKDKEKFAKILKL